MGRGAPQLGSVGRMTDRGPPIHRWTSGIKGAGGHTWAVDLLSNGSDKVGDPLRSVEAHPSMFDRAIHGVLATIGSEPYIFNRRAPA
jgi:hypothetical protein